MLTGVRGDTQIWPRSTLVGPKGISMGHRVTFWGYDDIKVWALCVQKKSLRFIFWQPGVQKS